MSVTSYPECLSRFLVTKPPPSSSHLAKGYLLWFTTFQSPMFLCMLCTAPLEQEPCCNCTSLQVCPEADKHNRWQKPYILILIFPARAWHIGGNWRKDVSCAIWMHLILLNHTLKKWLRWSIYVYFATIFKKPKKAKRKHWFPPTNECLSYTKFLPLKMNYEVMKTVKIWHWQLS